LFYSRAQDRADIEDWLALSGVHLVVQMEDLDLGRRMEHAMQHAFGCGHQRVVVIGTDVPDLTGSLVDRALLALDRNQGVFGPAVDGGYYLLALSILPPGLFQVRRNGKKGMPSLMPLACPHNQKQSCGDAGLLDVISLSSNMTVPNRELQGIRWSTPAALADTLNNACRLGMHVAPLETLETLPDIDTLQDLQEWCNSKQRTLQHGRQLEPQLQHQQQEVEGCSLLDVSFQVAGCRELTRR
jgi:glycosyltransferase A (GT-A) superfamily protein (DUF2064 family)